MKHFFGIILATVFAAVSAASDVTAYEGQLFIGSIPVTSANKSTLVAVAFKEFSSTEQNICVSNILSTVNLQVGDQVLVYSDSTYSGWQLNASGQWEAITKATIDAMGGTGAASGTAADAVRPAIGTSFWLIRTDSSGSRNLSLPFYLYGRYVTGRTGTAVAGAKSLMGNPTSSDKAPTITGAVDGDKIALLAGDDKFLNEYTYKSSTQKWTHLTSAGTGKLPTITECAAPTIPAGNGFWYLSNGSTDVTFTWGD